MIGPRSCLCKRQDTSLKDIKTVRSSFVDVMFSETSVSIAHGSSPKSALGWVRSPRPSPRLLAAMTTYRHDGSEPVLASTYRWMGSTASKTQPRTTIGPLGCLRAGHISFVLVFSPFHPPCAKQPSLLCATCVSVGSSSEDDTLTGVFTPWWGRPRGTPPETTPRSAFFSHRRRTTSRRSFLCKRGSPSP